MNTNALDLYGMKSDIIINHLYSTEASLYSVSFSVLKITILGLFFGKLIPTI